MRQVLYQRGRRARWEKREEKEILFVSSCERPWRRACQCLQDDSSITVTAAGRRERGGPHVEKTEAQARFRRKVRDGDAAVKPLREVRRPVGVNVKVWSGAHTFAEESATHIDTCFNHKTAAAAALVAVSTGAFGHVEIEVGDRDQLRQIRAIQIRGGGRVGWLAF